MYETQIILEHISDMIVLKKSINAVIEEAMEK